MKAYRRAADDTAVEEAVIVSTCNRVEIYGNVPSYHAGFGTDPCARVASPAASERATEDLAWNEAGPATWGS